MSHFIGIHKIKLVKFNVYWNSTYQKHQEKRTLQIKVVIKQETTYWTEGKKGFYNSVWKFFFSLCGSKSNHVSSLVGPTPQPGRKLTNHQAIWFRGSAMLNQSTSYSVPISFVWIKGELRNSHSLRNFFVFSNSWRPQVLCQKLVVVFFAKTSTTLIAVMASM